MILGQAESLLQLSSSRRVSYYYYDLAPPFNVEMQFNLEPLIQTAISS